MISKMYINLFYPASYLPHKNHILLFKLVDKINILNPRIKFILTINKQNKNYSNIEFLGRVDRDKSIKLLKESSGMIFLSSFESLGIPLIEAVKLSKPIVAPDLPYSREILNNNAYFFSLDDFNNTFLRVIENFTNDYKKNKLIRPKLAKKIYSSEQVLNNMLQKLST